MVNIQLLIEGGESFFQPNKNTDLNSTSNRLRQGFRELLEQEISSSDLNEYVRIDMGGGWREVKKYYEEVVEDKENTLMLVDSDISDDKKEEQRIKRGLEPKENVFFMVQKMEAWFLSQPEILDEYYAEADESIAIRITKNPKEYSKPDKALNEILKAHYPRDRRQRYKKMKHDAELMQLLDLSKLKEDFDDVQRLINTLQTKIATDA